MVDNEAKQLVCLSFFPTNKNRKRKQAKNNMEPVGEKTARKTFDVWGETESAGGPSHHHQLTWRASAKLFK